MADLPSPLPRRLFDSLRILTVDIGATRTKFMYHSGNEVLLLKPIDSNKIWVCPEDASQERMGELFQIRLRDHLLENIGLSVGLEHLDRVIFSVPGTVDIESSSCSSGESQNHNDEESSSCVVRNMPLMAPGFRGFNFKRGFTPIFPNAKIYAVADNIAAAMGVASLDRFRQSVAGLVIILGTSPAVATFFRGAAGAKEDCSSAKAKSIELGSWHSWVWFTKIPLKDPFGYCGGLRTEEGVDGHTVMKLKDKTEYKIPHEKSRIRFAIDKDTWKRLRGKLDWLDSSLQGNLSKECAIPVWNQRVQSAVDALCLKFHQLYGKPDVVVLLGGNAIRCSGHVSLASYNDPDYSSGKLVQVPVFVPPTDEDQQLIHMKGLAQAAAYRITQVYACGSDPLARGWTRGGELFLWVKRREII